MLENTAMVRITYKNNDRDNACDISEVSSYISVPMSPPPPLVLL